ncbi:hypothetical protein DID78_00475 [Candidatus Marinamargulisbacteria bacterium SCGC AG-343-D04]|nr:hypothetical protein DID78_00475 [Candidatus Marinamargulisbacteria bacterium SCGC AG-343-D04]
MNAAIHGFSSPLLINVLIELKKQKIIDPKYWIHDCSETPKLKCEKTDLYYDLYIQNKFKIEDNNPPLDLFDELEPCRFRFMVMNSRHQIHKYPLECVVTRNIYDDYHLYYRLIHYFYSILKSKKINLVIFNNFPHEGPDYVLYIVAKALKVKTLLLYQTIFPNKCLCINNIEDIEMSDKNMPIVSKPIDINIDTFLQKPFYMKKTISAETQLDELKNNYTFKEYIKKHKWKLIKFMILGEYKAISSVLNNRGPGSRITKLKKYIELYKKYATKKINKNDKYVYFPLHLQPELSTDTLGDKYYDQLRPIEELSGLIPENVKIYVKENPYQWESHRPIDFFDRLFQIKNVVLLDHEIDSISLIKNAEFTATISGTAGWESILLKKPALIFGLAWYKPLPGIFHIRNNPTYESITTTKIDLNLLKKEIASITSKFFDGIFYEAYTANYSSYNESNNQKALIDILRKKIQQ